MVYCVDDRIFIENLYKFKNYNAKNLLDNFLRKVLIWISCKQNWERWQYDKASMKRTTSQCAHWWRWFCQWIDLESERCTRVTEPHVKFHERQEFITLWYNVLFVSIWRSNASGCAQELTVTNCALHRTRTQNLLRCFPASAVWMSYFNWWSCVKASGRHYEHLIWSYFSVLCVHFKFSD